MTTTSRSSRVVETFNHQGLRALSSVAPLNLGLLTVKPGRAEAAPTAYFPAPCGLCGRVPAAHTGLIEQGSHVAGPDPITVGIPPPVKEQHDALVGDPRRQDAAEPRPGTRLCVAIQHQHAGNRGSGGAAVVHPDIPIVVEVERNINLTARQPDTA